MITTLRSRAGLPTKTARKTADQSFTNTTTLADVTDLSFAIGANETWRFSVTIYADGPATADIQYGFTVPSGCTVVWGAYGGQSATLSSVQGLAVSGSGTATNYGTAGTGTAGINVIFGIARNGATAGTVQLQGAQNTANATPSKILADSSLEATKL